jgi:taurine dioxygenase
MNQAAEIAVLPAIRPSGAALGADVEGIDMNKTLSADPLEAVKAAWSRHLVLRFRGQQGLGLAGLITFSRYFGSLDRRPGLAREGMSSVHDALPPEITVISNVQVDGKPLGALGDGEAVWHADMTYNERPPKGSCLYAVEVPATGGNTQFSNMYMAYATLPSELKRQIEGLRCVHDASRNSAGELRLGYSDITDPRHTVGAQHPLVAVHPDTGRKYLLLGRRRNAYVCGLPLEESETLLDRLWDHATQPQFTWTQVWNVGDVVMWDNRCTMHRRDSFDPGTRRVMYRTQISGDAVVGAVTP